MSVIVAFLAGIYQQISLKTEADYNAYLVIEEYYCRWDKKYGAIIFAPPPLNLIAIVFMPILSLADRYWQKKPEKVIELNTLLSKIAYFPILLLFFVLFFAC